MPRLILDIPEAEWSTLRADYERLRARGWRVGDNPGDAGRRFARAALLAGARVLATDAELLERAAAAMRALGRVQPRATDGQATALALGRALSLGLRLLTD